MSNKIPKTYEELEITIREFFSKNPPDPKTEIVTRELENGRIEVSGPGIYMTITKQEWNDALFKSANEKLL